MMCCLLEAYHSLLLGFPLLQVLAIAGVLTNVIAGHGKKTVKQEKLGLSLTFAYTIHITLYMFVILEYTTCI